VAPRDPQANVCHLHEHQLMESSSMSEESALKCALRTDFQFPRDDTEASPSMYREFSLSVRFARNRRASLPCAAILPDRAVPWQRV